MSWNWVAVQVTCRHCGVTWGGTENSLARHEEICSWPRCTLHGRMLDYDDAESMWRCPVLECAYELPDSGDDAQ